MQKRFSGWFSLLALSGALAAPVFGHSYGPVARLTGAPGDSVRACTSCHVGTVNSGTGSVAISLPGGAVYIPGVRQRVTVKVSDATQQRWGFELTARLNSDLVNGQAGDLNPSDNLTQVICEDNGPAPCGTGVSFIEHTSAGTRNGTKGGAVFQFDWTPPATNAGPVTLYVAGNAANGDGSLNGDLIYTSSLQVNPVVAVAPSVATGSVVSSATYAAGPVAPNSWVTVYGSNFGVTTRAWVDSDFVNGGMPVSLDGVSVVLTAFGAPRRAYVGFVSPTQVNFLLPSDTNATTVQVQVRNGAGISAQMPITVQANAPQLLTADGKYTLAFHANGGMVSKAVTLSTTPAAPGEVVTLYCTGGGATSPALVPGQSPAAAASLVTLPKVTVGGTNAVVSAAGIVPGSPGVYQVTVQVPADAVSGDLPVVVVLGTFTSASTLIAVQK